MPQTFDVTSSDGRKITLTGDSPPTETELEEIFRSFPPVTKKAGVSLLDVSPGLRTIKDLAVGAGKELGSFAIGAGETVAPALRMVPGVKSLVATPEQFQEAKNIIGKPEGFAQKAGAFGIETAEYAIPAGKITGTVKGASVFARLVKQGISARRAAMAAAAVEGVAQGATAAGVTSVAGREEAGTVGVLNALAPVATKAIELGAPVLRATAQKKLAQLLATGMEDKGHGQLVDYALKTGVKTGEAVRGDVDNAIKIVRAAASELLDLPVMASWGKWQTMLASRTESAKPLLGTALKSSLGDVEVPIRSLVSELETTINESASHFARLAKGAHAADPTVNLDMAGGIAQKVYDQPLFKELTALKDELATYDNTITVRNLVDIKRVWDKTVYTLATAGKVNADPSTLISSAMKEAAFTGANAIRRVLEESSPTISKLNDVVSHAIKLEDLVRKVAIAHPGMSEAMRNMATAVGAAGGLVLGRETGTSGYLGAVVGLSTARLVTKAMDSPLWHTMLPATRNRLAVAIQSGQADTVRKIVLPLVSATASQPSSAGATP